MSVTEAAHSPRNSLDARRSECVNVGPFEEEDSNDWRPNRTSLDTEVADMVVKEQPAVQRTAILATDPLPKEMSNLVQSEIQLSQQNDSSEV